MSPFPKKVEYPFKHNQTLSFSSFSILIYVRTESATNLQNRTLFPPVSLLVYLTLNKSLYQQLSLHHVCLAQ